ncbi:glycosyltransferase family 2 protein [Synechococcus sp. HJ21-Hayes]|uniref:glycosyltransferase family 2 protein n=1 Tax=Synechococcus sp. HJ21-Hayes TaxID=2823736 RepID=UPI0020CF5F0A|nr:glycosyltransferase family 2 protein [Synechococcus sp. HJ21-Hayes]
MARPASNPTPAEPPPQTVAGVVLCLNEAVNLPRCLASMGWCDELLVLDSGSSDGSQRCAASLGARVLEHRQPGRFLISDQRNWALEHAGLQSTWVLFVDADEEVGPACRAAIQRCIAAPNAAEGYELTPRYWFLGRWLKRTQGYPNWHPRLLRRGLLRFEGGVWESFSAGGRVERIPEPYEHYAFSKGIDDWLERHRRYADWEAERITSYLANGDRHNLGTRRWLRLRQLTARLWPLRPALRFGQKYALQGGFLEGWQGLLFALLMAGYDLITAVKVIERRRQRQGLPL